ncbi:MULTISPECIES: response regulator [Xanthobacter]|uniref:response regulator n=1 Tax=Xanthobacter TaxID=279 RepID=UPI001F202118|nr:MULTISPECIES: response regulator [unclassified Xanthobacter]
MPLQRTILLVEDDREIRSLLADFLGREGFGVLAAEDGVTMDRLLHSARPDLVVLDLMLPGEDGLSICRRLRARSSLPILMLTAKGDDVDRIVGLEMGADDYLPKPFNPRELLARIRAVLRRTETQGAPEPTRRLAFAGFVADLDARGLTHADGVVELTSAEFELLACFLERPKRVLSRDQLLDWTRGRTADPFDRTIDVSVSRLRRKLSTVDGEAGGFIKTVRNGGYLFALDVRVL